MKRSHIGLLAMAALAGSLPVPFYTEHTVRGHRTPPEPTEADAQRQAAAEAKRQRKAAKRAQIAARAEQESSNDM